MSNGRTDYTEDQREDAVMTSLTAGDSYKLSSPVTMCLAADSGEWAKNIHRVTE